LTGEINRLDSRRAFIITGTTLTREGLVRRIEETLGPRWAGTFSGTHQHVPSQTVIAAAEAARDAGADLLISFGGGSPIDTTKAVAAVIGAGLQDRAALIGKLGTRLAANLTLLPQIAIPTTLSAAEFTPVAGVTDEDAHIKGGFSDERMTPRLVILDPELTVATGRELWASTGIKALDHAVESVYSTAHQPLTDAAALEAIRLLFAYLPHSVGEPPDLEARAYCQIAAWLSIFGIANVRMGLSHALGHQIGARCNVPHGVTSCITLPHVMRFLASATANRQALMAMAMGIDTRGISPEAAAVAAAGAVEALIRGLGLPHRLRDAGVSEADLENIVRAAFPEASRSNSPRPVGSEEELLQLLHHAW
jgi:alcohol dehydrogenase